MKDLQLIKNESYNCFQYLVVMVAKYYNCDYRLMMLELWGFSYDRTLGLAIGDRLKLCWNSKIEKRKQLLRTHGISYQHYSKQEIDIEKYLDENLERTITAIYIDSFLCQWVPYFQKIHRPHAFFVIQSSKNDYLILDQYCKNGVPITISRDFVKANCESVITFCQENDLENNNMLKFLFEKICDWETSGLVQYKYFIEDMKCNLDVNQEIQEDPVASKLIMYLKNLSDDRLNFIEAICLFEEKFSIDLSLCKSLLSEISTRYLKLRGYLIKCAILKKKPQTVIVSEEIDCIYREEKKVFDILKEVYDNYQYN